MFRYILLDSCQHPRFHQKLQQWNVLCRSLFEGHAEEALPEIAPLLIDVTTDGEATRKVTEETTRIGQLKPCVSVLESTLPLLSLTEHLAQFHLIEMPDGRSMLMRWYDTRILPVWLNVLTAEQRMFFTRNITRWTSIDRFGIEQEHVLPERDMTTPQALSFPLQLDEHQADQLFSAAEPDALIFELRKTIRAEIDRVPQHVLYPFVQKHWQMARLNGLSKTAEQLQLLMLALYSSGAFIEHPCITELFASLTARQQSFSYQFNTLPESVWSTGKPLWEHHTELLKEP